MAIRMHRHHMPEYHPHPSFTRSDLLILLLGCAMAQSGCATLPNASLSLPTTTANNIQNTPPRKIATSKKSTFVLAKIPTSPGNMDLLQKNLTLEKTINPDNPLLSGNKTILLQDGPSTYAAMFTAILNAHETINLETYIFEDGNIGEEFAALLMNKQAQGVQVNLIYDSVGSVATPDQFFQNMMDRGIHVVEFNPINPLTDNSKTWRLNNRDHRKLLVVDGKIAFVGGINISNAYSSGSVLSTRTKSDKPVMGWRDTHVEIVGPAVAEFQKLFLDTWQRQGGIALTDRNYFPPLTKQGNEIIQALGNVADDPAYPIYLALLTAINNAEKQVHLTNAYFVPDPQLIKVLTEAAQRGVDVKLILPSHSDSWMTFNAGRSHYTELLKAGVKIYERRGAVMHAKTATIDGVWSSIGSTNLDWRSFLHNDELNAVILGSDFANQMETMFNQDLAQSNQINLGQWQQRPLNSHLKEWLSRLPEYWL